MIDIIRQLSNTANKPPGLILGIGDDSAVWQCHETFHLCTTDMLVEGVHFKPKYTSWADLGRKALAVNLSDIAAMGGNPEYALVSLGIRRDTDIECISQMMGSMVEIGGEFGVYIIGGDTTESPIIAISVTVIGRTIDHRMMTRSGAVIGDQIAVTGHLGASAAGLKLLQNQPDSLSPPASLLTRFHLCPYPRVKEGITLVTHGVKAAIDISDGLIADLSHICRASGVSAQIRANDIPVDPAVQECFPSESLELAVSGGEDYELLFAAPADIMNDIIMEGQVHITVIGEITEGESCKVVLLDQTGKSVQVDRSGWEHFIR